MSNGVEVIVATDRSIRPGEPEYLRLLSSTVTRPITLAPHTLTNHMSMILTTDDVDGDDNRLASSFHIGNHFLTKTYRTVYAYPSTVVKNGDTEVSTRKTTVSNIVMEEVLPYASLEESIEPTSIRDITLTESPSLQTEVRRTAYTYLNTLLDGEQPLVVTSRRTVSNTVTTLPDELEPSEVYPTTNTYLRTLEFTTTLTDGSDSQIVSTKDLITQVVVTSPLERETIIKPMTTEVTKTYFVTYTYFSTYIDGANTKVKSDVSVSSDVTIEKFYIKPKKTSTSKHTEAMTSVTKTSPLNIAVTKTYLTTFTYFTTMLLGHAGEKAETKIATRTRVMQNVVTETLSHNHFNDDYLLELRDSLENQGNGSLVTMATLKGGEKIQITAFEGGLIPVKVTQAWSGLGSDAASASAEQEIQDAQTIELTKTRFPKPSPTVEAEASSTTSLSSETSSNEILAEALTADYNDVAEEASIQSVADPQASNHIDRTEAVDVNPTQTTEASSSLKNEEEEISDAETNTFADVKEKPPKQPNNDSPVNFLNLTSLGINGISVLKPVINAMAELINNNINNKNSGSFNKLNSSISAAKPHPEKKPLSSNINPLLNFVSGLKAPPKPESKHKPTTPRIPVYIPVGSFAEDPEISESQVSAAVAPNLPPTWLDAQGKNMEKNRIDNGLAILEGGIPISPGQIITTNSDVIIGRPGSSGPRPPHFAVKDNFPIDMKPPPPPNLPLERPPDDVVGQHSTIKNVKPNLQLNGFKDHRQKSTPTIHDSGAIDLNPPPVPPKILTVHRPITINHKPHEIIPYKPDHGQTNVIPIPVHLRESYVPQIESDVSILGEGQLNVVGQPTPIAHLISQNGILQGNGQNAFIVTDDVNMADRSTGHPLLVNIQPSQVANIVIPPGSSTAVIINNEKQHALKGEVIDDPSPHPEPETVGFVGAEPVLRLENGEVKQKIRHGPGDKRRPAQEAPQRHQQGNSPHLHHGGGQHHHYPNHHHNFEQSLSKPTAQQKVPGLRFEEGNAGLSRLPPEYNHRLKEHSSRVPVYGGAHHFRDGHLPFQNHHSELAHPNKVNNGIYVDISPPGHLPPRSDFPQTQGNVVALKPAGGIGESFSNHQSGMVHDVPLNAQVQLGSASNKHQIVKDVVLNVNKYDNVKSKHPGPQEGGQNLPKKPNNDYDSDLQPPPPPPPPHITGGIRRPIWSYGQHQIQQQPHSPNNFMVPPPQVSYRPNYKPPQDSHPGPLMIPIGAGAPESGHPYPRPEDLVIVPHNQATKNQIDFGFSHGDLDTGDTRDPVHTEDGEELQESNSRPLLPGQIPTEIQKAKVNISTAADRPLSVQTNYKPGEINNMIKYGVGRPHAVPGPIANRPIVTYQNFNYYNNTSQGTGISYATTHGGQLNSEIYGSGDKIFDSNKSGNGIRVQRPVVSQDVGHTVKVEATVENVGMPGRPKIPHIATLNATRTETANLDKVKNKKPAPDDVRHHPRPGTQNIRRPYKPYPGKVPVSQARPTPEHWWISHGAYDPRPTKNQDRPNPATIQDSTASGTAPVGVTKDTKDKGVNQPVRYDSGSDTRGNTTADKEEAGSQQDSSSIQYHWNHAPTAVEQKTPRPKKPIQNVTPHISNVRPLVDSTHENVRNRTDTANTRKNITVDGDRKKDNVGGYATTTQPNVVSHRPISASGISDQEQKQKTTQQLPQNHATVYDASNAEQAADSKNVWTQPKPATEGIPQGNVPVEANTQSTDHSEGSVPSRIPPGQTIKWSHQNLTNFQLGPNPAWHLHQDVYRNRTSFVSEINGLLTPPKPTELDVMGLSPPPPDRPRRPQRPQRPKPPYKFEVPTTPRAPIAIENDFPPVRSPDFNKKPVKPQDIFPPKLPENFIHHLPDYPVRAPKPRPPPGPPRPPVTSLPIDVPEVQQPTESNEISKIYGTASDINGHSKPLNEDERLVVAGKRPKPHITPEDTVTYNRQTETPHRPTERPVRPLERLTERPKRPVERYTENPVRPIERLTGRPIKPIERPAAPIDRQNGENPSRPQDRHPERPITPFDRQTERPLSVSENPLRPSKRPAEYDVVPSRPVVVPEIRTTVDGDVANVIRGSETVYEPIDFVKFQTPGMKDSSERRKIVTTLITTGSTTIFADFHTPRPTVSLQRHKTTATADLAGDEELAIAPTHTTTLTVTSTLTTVVHSNGQKPLTKTIVLTKTILSTIVDKVTETQTLVKPTTATVTQTHTIATTKTALIVPTDLHPTPTKKHPGATFKPEIFVADPHSKDTMTISVSTSMNKEKKADGVKKTNGRRPETTDADSILVMVSNKRPGVDSPADTHGSSGDVDDRGGDLVLGGVFNPTHRYKSPTWRNECIPECRPTRNERCQKLDGAMKCVCRPGFARMFPDRPCMPTYTYNMKLLLDMHGYDYQEDLTQSESANYLQMKAITKEGLDRLIMQSELRDIFHGVSVNGFEPHERNAMVDFYLQLSENTDETKLMDVFTKTLRNSNFSLGGTDLYAARELATLEAEDFNECLHPKYHDCSENARCFNLKGTYTCSCKEGFTDLSENSLFPGRVCSDMIGCEYCSYHGSCYTRGEHQTTCECFQWYSGERCRINLKVLLIALVTVGSILLALLCLCGILMCLKRRSRSSNASKTNGSAGYLRYRGPPNQSLDKRAMIAADSSSESSVDNLPYINPPPPPPLSGTLSAKRKPALRHSAKGPAPRPMEPAAVEQQDRSVTVMIPRAKYRPVPPMSPLMTMSTFSPDKHIHRSTPQISTEQKLINYLEGNAREGAKLSYAEAGSGQANIEQKHSPKNYDTARTAQVFRKEHRVFEYEYKTSNMQINDGTSSGERRSSKHGDTDRKFRRHSDSTHLNSENTRSFQHRKYSAGALVSAGYEVSATVGLRHPDFDTSEDEHFGILQTGTMKSNRSQFTTLNRTGDHKTMSEARSYDETTVHPATRTLKTNYSGSSPSSRVNNDEGHTMVERDIGSTFIMPESHLFKPEQDRGSDLSTFDSL